MLWVVDLLRDVRDGREPPQNALAALIEGAATGSIPDYQLSAFLMAVYHRGLSDAQIVRLTLAMRDSGQCIDLRHVPGRKVDKHSTGGVGDKVSLHLAPWVAACGVPVPMVSGRGLGHTGGTLDKLDSIPGFRHDVDLATFARTVAARGVCMMGQSAALAPADGKLYALRDVTATVESIPLITASILAKKLAEGIDALVLDVKVGDGAFMKDIDQARALARSIVAVGGAAGLPVRALITDMQAPLGNSIGNALEVRESIAILHNRGPADTMALTLELGAEMLVLGERVSDVDAGKALMMQVLESGQAWQKFRDMVQGQGGSLDAIEDGGRGLPQATEVTPIVAATSGFIGGLDAYALGHAAMAIGAGRSQAAQSVDPSVGLVLPLPVGSQVKAGDAVVEVHHCGPLPTSWRGAVEAAIHIQPDKPQPRPIVWEKL